MTAWLAEHAADMVNCDIVGQNDRTPYERLKGRRFVGHMLSFGIMVMFRVSGKVRSESSSTRGSLGVGDGPHFSPTVPA